MKHFVVSLTAGAFMYDFKCSRINEAFQAVLEASAQFDITVDLDRVMTALVHMDEENKGYYERGCITIAVREGEV